MFDASRTPVRVGGIAALILTVGFTASACSGGTGTGTAGATASVAGSTGSKTMPTASRAGHGSSAAGSADGSGATSGSHSAVVLASAAVAKQTVPNVVMLHALAYNAGRHGGIPAAQIAPSARTVAKAFAAEIADSTMMTPPAGSSAAKFVAALRTYESLAQELGSWNSATGAPVASAYWSTIKQADDAWLAALASLGKATGQNLTASMAPLLYGH
jgi:hypothetical protein